MAGPTGPFYLLRAGTGQFLCYWGSDGAVYVTDAVEVWAGEFGGCPAIAGVCAGGQGAAGEPGAEPPGGAGMDLHQARPGRTRSPPPVPLQRCPPEELGAMLRAGLGRGAAALSLGRGSATLRLPEEPRCPALALTQLPAAEACSQLQALLFGMAGCIESLQRRLEVAAETLASSCSPEKNTARSQQLFLPDPSPRKSRASDLALPAKRKVPGESLINPGFKSKKAPSGVNFEDS